MRTSLGRGRELLASALTLLEISVLLGRGSTRTTLDAEEILGVFEADPGFRIVPFTVQIALEVVGVGKALRDPFDRGIVATARVDGAHLLTSDQKIIESNLVLIVD
jgi:PIN domain nuclease of toxin-antitoxin system